MRITSKVDYAIRALAELASADETPTKAETIASAQDIPLNFLRDILAELRRDGMVRSRRGPEGGFVLGRPASTITLADVFRSIDGPLAEVNDQSLRGLSYSGAAEDLPLVWQAIRSALRRVLEITTIAAIAEHSLPTQIVKLAAEYPLDVATGTSA